MILLELAIGFWLLVSPGEGWTWVIVGGPYDSEAQCREERAGRLDRDRVLCVRH